MFAPSYARVPSAVKPRGLTLRVEQTIVGPRLGASTGAVKHRPTVRKAPADSVFRDGSVVVCFPSKGTGRRRASPTAGFGGGACIMRLRFPYMPQDVVSR